MQFARYCSSPEICAISLKLTKTSQLPTGLKYTRLPRPCDAAHASHMGPYAERLGANTAVEARFQDGQWVPATVTDKAGSETKVRRAASPCAPSS